MVPHRQAWVVERFGKFHKQLNSGLNLILPFIDKIAYTHSLKEEAIDVQEQMAYTADNVSIKLDGVLYVKITDPIKASYGVKNPHYAITQLVQTTMRSEIGKLTLDKTFEERESLNAKIVSSINEAATAWGIDCLRYEIKDITIPQEIQKAMELQMTAERQKRACILESEGLRQAEINSSEGKQQAEINFALAQKQQVILKSEGDFIEKMNRAKAESETIEQIAIATARAIEIMADAIERDGGEKAVAYRIAGDYILAFKELAKESTTMLMPSNPQDIASLVGQGLSIYEMVKKQKKSSFTKQKDLI